MRYILLMPLVLYSSIPKKKGWVTPRHSWSKHLKPLLVSYDRSILDEFVKLFRHILSRQLPRSPAELLRWNFPISHLVLNLPSLIPSVGSWIYRMNYFVFRTFGFLLGVNSRICLISHFCSLISCGYLELEQLYC